MPDVRRALAQMPFIVKRFGTWNYSSLWGWIGRLSQERARRLRLIRERLHKIKSQRQFAARLGVSYHTYNNWERGLPIPATEAKKIRDATPGVDGDYILWGDEAGLTVDALSKLKSND